MKYGGVVFRPDKEMIAKACHFLATYWTREGGTGKDKTGYYIDKGIENCSSGSKWLNRLNETKKRVQRFELGEERLHGIIQSINVERHFGIIKSSGYTFLFLFSGFINPLSPTVARMLVGKSVSFVLSENQGGRNRYIASDIELEH